jgi:2'-5' RNA ligase
MKRLFFAVMLPEEAQQFVRAMQTALQQYLPLERSIRWVEPHSAHYTLKFLGDTPEDRLTQISRIGQAVAAQMPAFSLTLAGLGAFPNWQHPKILWIGATKEVPVLISLAKLLDRGLAAQGFPPETRPFLPHLTLARIKTHPGEKSVANALQSEERILNSVDKFISFRVDCFTLMQSDRQPSGAIYTPRETFPLTGGA